MLYEAVIMMNFSCCMKQFKLGILALLYSEMFLLMGSNCCFANSINKMQVGIHLYYYQPILCRRSMVTELKILILARGPE